MGEAAKKVHKGLDVALVAGECGLGAEEGREDAGEEDADEQSLPGECRVRHVNADESDNG